MGKYVICGCFDRLEGVSKLTHDLLLRYPRFVSSLNVVGFNALGFFKNLP